MASQRGGFDRFPLPQGATLAPFACTAKVQVQCISLISKVLTVVLKAVYTYLPMSIYNRLNLVGEKTHDNLQEGAFLSFATLGEELNSGTFYDFELAVRTNYVPGPPIIPKCLYRLTKYARSSARALL
eukprot:6173978-Pleurochrysis_carterae.AAC.2